MSLYDVYNLLNMDLLLDEITDIAGLVILLVTVRYIHGTAAQENMPICKNQEQLRKKCLS